MKFKHTDIQSMINFLTAEVLSLKNVKKSYEQKIVVCSSLINEKTSILKSLQAQQHGNNLGGSVNGNRNSHFKI